MGGGRGKEGVKFSASTVGGGELTEKILKFLLKKTETPLPKIQKWSFRIFSVHAIEYQEKSENYMAQKLKLFFCSSFLVSLAFH